MASDRGYDEVIQHRHQVHVLLQAGFDILKHALRNVQTLHVDHYLSQDLGFGFLLVKGNLLVCSWSLRSTASAPGYGAVVVAEFRLCGDKAVLSSNRIMDFCNSFKNDTAEFIFTRGVWTTYTP